MDIAALSIAMHQDSLSQAVGTALMKKVIDTSEENSQSLIKSIELSINSNLGVNLDTRV